jgi:hypothetical protein
MIVFDISKSKTQESPAFCKPPLSDEERQKQQEFIEEQWKNYSFPKEKTKL